MKLSFIAGLAVGYVLGARAGRQRYEQIARTSGKVWHSTPVQKQVSTAKEAARTKAAPVVADMVADAARATGDKLRASKTVAAEAITTARSSDDAPGGATAAPATAGQDSSGAGEHADAWSAATRPTTRD